MVNVVDIVFRKSIEDDDVVDVVKRMGMDW